MASSPEIERAKTRFNNLLASIGRASLSSLYPNDFEYYACSLELTNSKDEIIETFVFPVMPSSMSENTVPINNIKKTEAGVVSLFNPTFNPFQINISGNFGRKLRVVTNRGIFAVNLIRTNVTKQAPLEGYEGEEFSVQVKTGYGLCKLMERICKRAYTLDSSNNPYRLYFYNMAFNSSYMVETPSITFSQDQSNNMIWNYNLSLKAICPAFAIRKTEKSSIINTLSSSVINAGTDALLNDIQSVISSRINKRI